MKTKTRSDAREVLMNLYNKVVGRSDGFIQEEWKKSKEYEHYKTPPFLKKLMNWVGGVINIVGMPIVCVLMMMDPAMKKGESIYPLFAVVLTLSFFAFVFFCMWYDVRLRSRLRQRVDWKNITRFKEIEALLIEACGKDLSGLESAPENFEESLGHYAQELVTIIRRNDVPSAEDLEEDPHTKARKKLKALVGFAENLLLLGTSEVYCADCDSLDQKRKKRIQWLYRKLYQEV